MTDQWEIKRQLIRDPVEIGWEPFAVDIDYLWLKRRVTTPPVEAAAGASLSELDETE